MAKQKPTKRSQNYKGRSRSNDKRRTDRNKEDSFKDTNSKSMEECPHIISEGKKNNDPSWYTHIYPVVSDVASIAYDIPVGTPFIQTTNNMLVNTVDGGMPISIKAQKGVLQSTIPGIMTIKLVPSIGVSKDVTSAPNVAAQQLYTLIRKANSGAANYDKTDPMMVVMAMDSAYMLYEELLRAYRLLGSYNYMSRYLPDALLHSLGFSPSLGKELANFRGILDLFAYKLGSINVPDQFDVIHRHSWLFTNVYTDSPDAKAQLFAYKPDGFYVWTEGQNAQPTYLKYLTRDELYGVSEVASLSQIMSAIDKVMVPILGSQDIGIISGDIAKAFGDGGMIKIMPVQDYETLQPVYSEEVLTQITNLTVMGNPISTTDRPSNMDITINYESPAAGPYFTHQPAAHFDPRGREAGFTGYSLLHKKLLNMHKSDPTPEDNMVATRLMSAFVADGQFHTGKFGANLPIYTCGTEWVSGVEIHVLQFNQDSGHLTSADPSVYKWLQEVIYPYNTITGLTNIDSNGKETMDDQMRSAVYSSSF